MDFRMREKVRKEIASSQQALCNKKKWLAFAIYENQPEKADKHYLLIKGHISFPLLPYLTYQINSRL